MSRQWIGHQCLGFLTCTQISMQATAHSGCTNTVKEPALTTDTGRKILNTQGTQTPVTVLCLFFQSNILHAKLYNILPVCNWLTLDKKHSPHSLLHATDLHVTDWPLVKKLDRCAAVFTVHCMLSYIYCLVCSCLTLDEESWQVYTGVLQYSQSATLSYPARN